MAGLASARDFHSSSSSRRFKLNPMTEFSSAPPPALLPAEKAGVHGLDERPGEFTATNRT